MAWEPEDRAKALAFIMEKAERCDMCGTAEWEWDQDRFAYSPEKHYCHGCYLKHIAGEEGADMPGTSIVMVPKRTAGKKVKAKRPGRRRG